MNETMSFWPPSTGWRIGSVFRKSHWHPGTTGPDDILFTSLSLPGSIAPDLNAASWSFVSGNETLSQEFRFWQFTNGWIAAPARSDVPRFSIFFVEPQVLLGHFEPPFKPALFSAEQNVHSTHDMQWLDMGNCHAALVFQKDETGQRFALSISFNTHTEAVRTARAALRADPLTIRKQEIQKREAFWKFRVTETDRRPVRAWALEVLAGALRPPKGNLPHRWSESQDIPNTFNLNELLPLTIAWNQIDSTVSEDLVRCALASQSENGFIPATLSPDTIYGTSALMWPTLACSVKEVLRHEENVALADYALPRLAKYISCALQRFQQAGRYAWTSEEESFIPPIFTSGMTSVDCVALLLWEMDAVLELSDQYGTSEVSIEFVLEERESLIRHLTNHLWDSESATFLDRLPDGQRVRRKTLAQYLPAGARELPRDVQISLLHKMGKGSAWSSSHGMLLWEEWPKDEAPPPASALHQIFLLYALLTGGAETKAEWFIDQLQSITKRCFKTRHQVPSDLQTQTQNGNNLHGAALVAALDVPAHFYWSQKSSQATSKILAWLDQRRIAIFLSTLTIALVTLFSVVFVYLFRGDPTSADIEILSSMADRHYADGRYEESIRLYSELAEHLPGNQLVHVRLANAFFRQGQYPEAAYHYRLGMDTEFPAPRVLRNYGLSLFRQGLYAEAQTEFIRLIELYGDQLPRLKSDAEVLLDLIEERQLLDRSP